MNNVKIITAVSTIRGFGYSSVWIYSSLYFHSILKIPYLEDGLIFTVGGIFSAFVSLYGGSLGDRIGHKTTILISLLVQSLTFAVILSVTGLALSPVYYPVAFIVIMSANSLQAPSINALVSLSSSVNLKGFSILRVGNNIGWGFGPAIGGFIISSLGYRDLFFFALICLIVSLLISLAISRNYGSKVGAGLSYSRNRAVLILSFVVFLVMMVQSQETVTLTNYAVSIRNIAVSELGFIYLTNGLFVILLQAPIYILTRKIGIFRSYWIGTFLYVFGFLSFGFDSSFLGLIISTVALTVGEDFSFPVGYSIVSDVSRPENIGRNMGLYNAFMTFGRALGPSIGGLSFSITRNPVLLWFYTTLSGFAGLIIFIFAFKGKKASIGKSL